MTTTSVQNNTCVTCELEELSSSSDEEKKNKTSVYKAAHYERNKEKYKTNALNRYYEKREQKRLV